MKALYVANDNSHGRSAALAARRITIVMSAPVVTIHHDEPLATALSIMVRQHLRHLVVIDERGCCLGVLSDRAITSAWARDHSALDRHPVTVALDAPPAVVAQGAAVLDAARMMRSSGVDAVAVVDTDRHPVGIVTGSDLISLLAS